MNDSTALDTATLNYLIETTQTLKQDVDASNNFDLGITLILIALVMYFGYKKLEKK